MKSGVEKEVGGNDMMTAITPTTTIDPALAAVLDDARLAGANLALVADEQGAVLSGTVRNIWQYQTLRAMLKRSPVVIDVGISAVRRSDAEIAEAIADTLGPEGAAVQARVRSGIVTLAGRADMAAHAAVITGVGTLPGVAGIVDNIRA